MNEALLIVAISFPAAFFVCFILFGLGNYKKRNGKSFDFLKEFPYELIGESSPMENLLVVIFYDAFLLSFSILSISQILLYYKSSSLISFILVGALFALAFAISMIWLGLTSASKEKEHTMRFVVSSALLSIFNFVNGIALFALSKGYAAEIGMKVMGGLCFGVSIFVLLVMLNPKLKNWPALESVSEKDGTVSYRRPRPFPLAASEWAILVLALIGIIIAGIGNLLVIL